MTQPRKLPSVSQDLIDYLDISFPNACPHPAATDREIWMAVGARQVVKRLEVILKTLHEGSLLNGSKRT